MNVKNILFMGSPAFAVPSLQILNQHFKITAVFTQPPRPAGRGQGLQKTAIHEMAEQLGLLVFHPEKLQGEALDHVLSLPCDAIAVVAYGLLLPKQLVEERLCLNLHPSALPRWRGAAPLQHTLLNGDTTTDICIMKLDEGMDTGPVYSRTLLPVPADMTYGHLHNLCADKGAEQLATVLKQLPDIQPTPQQGKSTHAFKLTAEHRALDWTKPATTLHNQIRAFSPVPGATANLASEALKLQGSSVITTSEPHQPGEIIHLDHDGLTIATGQGALHITHLQRPGKKMLPVETAAQGWPTLKPGAVFTAPIA